MSNLYKDAILDAKALRASAMANAKAALEEAFEPKIQEMIAKHLSEEEEMDEAKDHEMEEGYDKHEEGEMHGEEADINEQELDEILNQLEELDSHEDKADLKEAEEGEEEGEEEESEEGEEGEDEEGEGEEGEDEGEAEEGVTDETKVIDITLGDLKQVLQSVMPATPDTTTPEPEGEEADDEAEVSLEEILDELEAEGMEEPGHRDPGYKAGRNTPQEAAINEDFGLGSAALGAGAVAGLSTLIALIQRYYKQNPKATGAAVMNALEKMGTGAAAGARNAPPSTGEPMEESFNEAIDMSTVAVGLAAIPATAAGIAALMNMLKKKNPKLHDMLAGAGKAAGGSIKGGTTSPQSELEEAKSTIATLRQDLQEVNLLNAKYLYMNKLFKSKSLTESEKVKVINSLDRATNVKEVKLTYETLKESFEKKKETIKESIGFASKPAGVAPKANIMEADQFISRWQKLAGIK
jgi:hypothetical protein